MTEEPGYASSTKGAPVVIVSEAFMKQTVKDPYIASVNIRYDKEYDEDTEKKIKEMMNASPYVKDFSYDSKIESMQDIQKAQGNMEGVGMGIALILALIGGLNYINTVFGSIQSRRMTFSIMESVGMTKGQMKQMLVREGLLVGAASLGITVTAGLGITYLCYRSMSQRGIPFAVPAVPAVLAAVLVMMVCIVVPLVSYGCLAGRKTLVERIREGGQD